METQGIMKTEDYLKEVIKLQLKKPKSWNWELTTSKSSPHLALPIIQLFDSKGNLLVEAKDTGIATERRSWHSACSQPASSHRPIAKVQRCSSDILHHPMTKSGINTTNRPLNNIKNEAKNEKLQTTRKQTVHEEDILHELNTKRRYRRTRSDDVYKRILKDNDNNDEDDKLPKVLEEPEECKYEMRTSSAGTLIVKRYSFTPTTRRRHKRSSSDSYKFRRSLSGDRESAFKDEGKCSGVGIKDNRYRSSVDDVVHTLLASQNFDGSSDVGLESRLLPHSYSDAYLLRKTLDLDDNCNYIIDEVTNPFSLPTTLRIKKYRKKIDQLSRNDANDVSSSEDEGLDGQFEMQRAFDHSFRNYKKRQSKAKAFKEASKKESNKNAESEKLERRCRLSPVEDVKMGANVSRHSSKGLSGRRTQSSSSICKSKKSKTEQPPQPVCGSLPSYLEASNNNHDYEKLPVNDVDRIPPLGDGAPLHWKFSDNQTVLCDQGYGSERSPEEEFPPPLPEHDNQCNHHLDIHSCYPFITPETTFSVTLAKGSRGLGLSVTGGIDSGGSWPGLIRVKRLFPHQPAAACGVLNVGDLILEANGVPLTGLTNYEALEVLRTSSSQVDLRLCRPPPDVLNCVSPISEVPPPPPRRDAASNLTLTPEQLNSDDDHNGEFEITMRKSGGSLGFTLRKEDDSALGHYIRALVRDPALTDGRIRPGDKIIAVNNVEISSMTHDEAVQFLRKCGQLVKLRLYRDAAQTPIATLSPTETTPRTSFTKKAQLRQEAMDMLNDIAVRKLLPNTDSYKSQSPLASPRRIRSRLNCPSDASQESTSTTTHYYVPEEQFHEGLLQRGGYLPFDEDSFNSLFINDDDDCDKPPRPISLELYNPNQTPVACRKPKFNFSLAHNAYELNNLDAEILDAPNLTYNITDEVNSTEVECDDSYPKEPASMPHLQSDNPGFSYKNPAYQSAHPICGSGGSGTGSGSGKENGTLEYKKSNTGSQSNTLPREPEKKPRRKKSIIKEPKSVPDQPEVLAIELNRGWNSRMGFSLQGPIGQTYVSAVYPNSVASKDGRIKEGDRIVKVNEDSVEQLSTNAIIDLLRILRGPVSIVLLRGPGRFGPYSENVIVNKDCTSKASNAAN